MTDFNEEYPVLIAERFEELKAKLKSLDVAVWVRVRKASIRQIAEKLAQTTLRKIAAIHFAEKETGEQFYEPNVIKKGWHEFFEVVKEDLKNYQNALVQSACIDWLKGEMESLSIDSIDANPVKLPVSDKQPDTTLATNLTVDLHSTDRLNEQPNVILTLPNIVNNNLSNDGIEEEQKRKIVLNVLSPLSGKIREKGKIMESGDYDRLIAYTTYFVTTGFIPESIEPIPKIKLQNSYIVYTYYRLFIEFSEEKGRSRKSFISFIKQVFRQLSKQSEVSLYANLASKPKNYDEDFKLIQ